MFKKVLKEHLKGKCIFMPKTHWSGIHKKNIKGTCEEYTKGDKTKP